MQEPLIPSRTDPHPSLFYQDPPITSNQKLDVFLRVKKQNNKDFKVVKKLKLNYPTKLTLDQFCGAVMLSLAKVIGDQEMSHVRLVLLLRSKEITLEYNPNHSLDAIIQDLGIDQSLDLICVPCIEQAFPWKLVHPDSEWFIKQQYRENYLNAREQHVVEKEQLFKRKKQLLKEKEQQFEELKQSTTAFQAQEVETESNPDEPLQYERFPTIVLNEKEVREFVSTAGEEIILYCFNPSTKQTFKIPCAENSLTLTLLQNLENACGTKIRHLMIQSSHEKMDDLFSNVESYGLKDGDVLIWAHQGPLWGMRWHIIGTGLCLLLAFLLPMVHTILWIEAFFFLGVAWVDLAFVTYMGQLSVRYSRFLWILSTLLGLACCVIWAVGEAPPWVLAGCGLLMMIPSIHRWMITHDYTTSQTVTLAITIVVAISLITLTRLMMGQIIAVHPYLLHIIESSMQFQILWLVTLVLILMVITLQALDQTLKPIPPKETFKDIKEPSPESPRTVLTKRTTEKELIRLSSSQDRSSETTVDNPQEPQERKQSFSPVRSDTFRTEKTMVEASPDRMSLNTLNREANKAVNWLEEGDKRRRPTLNSTQSNERKPRRRRRHTVLYPTRSQSMPPQNNLPPENKRFSAVT